VRRGRGFSYHEEDGTPIRDREVLDRIAELAIPPAWVDVWICPHPNGHIQATGEDDAGRKQYLYHPVWREHRDREKFDHMLAFARRLPALRKRLDEDLGLRGLQRDRVLACAVRLLDLGFFRIGSERYTAEHETYGLSTLLRLHVRLERGRAVFDYRAKGAQRRRQTIADASVLPTIRALKRGRAPGKALFAYWDGRHWVDVTAEQINEYLKAVSGADFTAKDFRTWNATVLAAVAIARRAGETGSKTAHRRIANAAVSEVAEFLGNTPAVCRSAYIDPRVFDRFDSGETIRSSLRHIVTTSDPGEFPDRERIERAVRKLLA
jgi:DNA topoisomerase I